MLSWFRKADAKPPCGCDEVKVDDGKAEIIIRVNSDRLLELLAPFLAKAIKHSAEK
jgi:hypothetical protein